MHDEDEIFYVLSGAVTFRCGGRSFKVKDGGFMFLPRGIPHSYTIESKEARLLGMCTPSEFGDQIERTGKPLKRSTKARRAS